ncbi:calmodulin-like protein 3 [Solanum dulcamara]|uniref:calmodulin-like protein 3 n=1 Tax=Solanum dulcamara TaxID=45834 RepID=UPI002485B30A|nr:calmodulin-like protein 3 [Solanum dulcamara]
MLTLLTILFLAILLIIGLLTTLFNFPINKFQSLIQSISLKSPSLQEKTIITPSPSIAMVDQKKVKSSNNYKEVELRGIFATFDKNNDGYITKQELKLSLKNIGIFMEDKDIVDMVEKVDSNKDGLIDLDEFYELCHTFLGIEGEEEGEVNQEEVANREKDLKEAFDVFDHDKDGLISEEELSSILSSLGMKQGKKLDHCKEMIKKVDVDGDGMVNFDEFKKMMKACGTLKSFS